MWEAGVKSCKYHIARVVGTANLTYEELSTVLIQIEAILNSRPLHPMSSDPNDLATLTPAHFLLGRPLTAPACEDVVAPITTLNRYKRVEHMRRHFWERWSKEYLSELQKRTKWQQKGDDLRPNMMVAIKEDNLPPLQWRLGRIISVFTGKDGVSRVASIKTADTTIKRAFSKICPLLMPDDPPAMHAAESRLPDVPGPLLDESGTSQDEDAAKQPHSPSLLLA